MRDADFIRIAKALADPTRYRVLQEIRAAGSLTCSDVCDRCPQSQPTISHHIKTLEKAGLISVRREGQFHVLTANERAIGEFAARLAPAGRRARAPRKS